MVGWLLFYGMSTSVGLFHAKVILTIMISNYMHCKSLSCPTFLGSFYANIILTIMAPVICTAKVYHVNLCCVILCRNQFNNYGLQLYALQKCIMSTFVGSFYVKISLTIMVSNYMHCKNYHVNTGWVILCQSQSNNSVSNHIWNKNDP